MLNMIYCFGSGVQIQETALSCSKCDAPQMASESSTINPQPRSNLTVALYQKWTEIFRLIDKAGGATLPNKQLFIKIVSRRVLGNGFTGLFSFLN